MSDLDNEQVTTDIPDEPVVTEETPVEVESKYTEADLERMEADLKLLDDGELNIRDRDRMTKLLQYILSLAPYTGEFNPHTAVTITDEVIEGMVALETIPENGVIISNHTVAEITELNRRLWRVILASQFKRIRLSRTEIDTDYVQLTEPRALLSLAEYDLLNYLSSSLALLQSSPTKDCLDQGEWSNSVSYNDKRIGIGLVTGHKDPIKRIKSKLNLINESATHMTHSGMVIKLASPSGLDAALLNDNIMSAKINHSYDSQGNALGSTSVYTNEILVEQIYRSIEDTNLGDITKETFEDNLSLLDVEQISAGLAVSMFSTGFTIHRRCGSMECDEVRSILVNPRRTILHRTDRLTESQLRHLSRGFSKVDISTIAEYRESLVPDVTKYVHIEEDVYLRLRVPMFSDYKRIARGWLDYITNKSLELVSGSSDEQARKAFIYDSFNKSTLMMYSPWIEGVYVKADSGDYVPHLQRLKRGKGITDEAISDADLQLDEFVADFRTNPELQTKLLKSLTNFIQASTLTVHVLPKTKCSKCGTDHVVEGEVMEAECISYSPSELFFTLLHLKTENVSA